MADTISKFVSFHMSFAQNCCGQLYEYFTHAKKRRRLQGWSATGVVGLRDEHLKELPAVLRDISARLKVIDASVNQIRSLPSFMGEFQRLYRLVLSHNELVALPESLFELRQLKVLILNHNKISTIPVNIQRLLYLEKLSMTSNCLTAIPEELSQLVSLKDIDFSDNRISDIRCDFQPLQQLESLSLIDNSLREIPLSLRHCVRMKELLLERNQLSFLRPEILVECASLQTLTLDGNPMSMSDLEDTPGYQTFEKRRKEKANKAISSQVMMSDTTLNEVITRRT